MKRPRWLESACAIVALHAAAAVALHAQTFASLVNFHGTNGAAPQFVSLVQGLDGNLYGTTQEGGANSGGTVFRMTPTGKLTTLHSFDGNDGANPLAGLVLGTDGYFYGTTVGGGAHANGTVFKITPSGKLTTLYSFCAQSACTDGATPYAGLIQAYGELYGTTIFGGASTNCPSLGCGTVFKITSSGTLTTLHSFAGYPVDGSNPYAVLVQGTNGDFYGTTSVGGGGSACGTLGCGTVFKITPGGTLTTLHNFNFADGFNVTSALFLATNGEFYGTTAGGGANPDNGTVFKITPSGKLTTLYSFCAQSGCTDGANPYGGLIQATDGKLYGATYVGGDSGDGTLFRITSNGTLTSLYSLSGGDGTKPLGLAEATWGVIYGVSVSGGASNDGTVFGLSMGLSPFVKTVPTSGKVGLHVKILGTSLTGATSVSFNGTPAAFTVNSSGSAISTTVPVGATTGFVTVTTPTGTLKSNVKFRVRP